ncbi:MAG: type II toxin-antitoxin system prevent-host-death family antitoxin [Alphaproteobacteria bacterium]|nr:type II toxin-antitoxin system prevent-host-death family antitoxin [Alphaproteobacteria bacterium]
MMITYSALDARSNFAEVLDIARRQPVAISKHKRIVSVIIAKEDYDRYQDLEEEKWMNYKTSPSSNRATEINDMIEQLEQKLICGKI